jgi:hypothetical protein
MKKFFSLMVIVAMSVSMVGCGDTKKPADKPATPPAADAPKDGGTTPPADAPMGK